MICNKNIRILWLVLISIILSCGEVFSAQYGRVSNSLSLDYSKVDTEKAYSVAEENFKKALNESDKHIRDELLREASSNYYIVVCANPADIKVAVKLARVYDMLKKNKYAKASFYQALGINPYDIDANYYFGEYFYSRNEYRKALYYYRCAIKYGKSESPDMLKKLAIIYEKFGDLKNANLYYKKLYLENPSDDFVADKIREIETAKYDSSAYRSEEKK